MYTVHYLIISYKTKNTNVK